VSALLACVVAAPSASLAQTDDRIVIDHVELDPKEMLLTIHADVFDRDGRPIEKLKAEAFQVFATDKALAVKDTTVQTADEAKEPVAIVILMSAAQAYMINSESEQHNVFDVEKEGALQFIGRLSGNDKVAVFMYREGFPNEPVAMFSSDFKTTQNQVKEKQPPKTDDAADPNSPIKGQGDKAKATLAPEMLQAVDKAMNYMVENLDKLGSARRRFLITMSDGKDREANQTKVANKVKYILEKYKEHKIRVYTIGYSLDTREGFITLQNLADSTGGYFIQLAVKDFPQIANTWDSLAGRIKKQYIITLKLSELPDWGEPIKGKDERAYKVKVKTDLPGGRVVEATADDVRFPAPAFAWMRILKIVGMVVGGLLGVGLLVLLIVWLVRRRREAPQEGPSRQQQQYDGPNRGKLTVTQGPLAGETFPLVDDVTTIGSMPGNTITIQDGSVSRRHAAIRIDEMRYEVADMGSTNGVLVNGRKIHKVFLKDGDRIQIGSTEMQFTLK